MLSYLPVPEPSWLNGPPEPSPCGKCPHCYADLFLTNEGDLETTPCSCGTALCCEECPRCSQCGDKVCSQCSATFMAAGREERVCSGCHQTYLDDLEDGGEIFPADVAPAPNAHVHPLVASILDSFIRHGVRP